MNHTISRQLYAGIRDFRLPRYAEITDAGLHLEQVTQFVNTYLRGAGCTELTPSMVSNYVKQKTIPGPVKKAYHAEAIAYLVFVAFTKNVLAMEDIRLLEAMQRESCPLPAAYDYFCAEFERVLKSVFRGGAEPAQTDTDEKDAMCAAIVASAQKIYLDQYLRVLRDPVPRLDE
jgi:hypothetical protein